MAELVSESVKLSPSVEQGTNIYDLSPAKLVEEMAAIGQPRYRASQVLHWLYNELVTEFSQMTNLPLELRSRLSERFQIGSAQLVAGRSPRTGGRAKSC